MRRYTRDQQIAGRKLETAQAVNNLRRAKQFGLIKTRTILCKESQRLDHIAHEYLGNSQDWWIIAALSDIGWGMQVPPGTIIHLPQSIEAIKSLVG